MLKEKLPFALINTLLLHIPLLAHTHPQTESQTERQIHSLRVGWRNFFPVVPLCQFFFVMAGNSFMCYLPTIPVVPLCLVAQVSFLVVAGKGFRCYLLTGHTSCAIVSVFWFWQEIVFGCTVSKKDSYLVSLRERGPVYLSLYRLTVTIVSQKYQELSLQVEISE
jgi:hypothetical protein